MPQNCMHSHWKALNEKVCKSANEFYSSTRSLVCYIVFFYFFYYTKCLDTIYCHFWESIVRLSTFLLTVELQFGAMSYLQCWITDKVMYHFVNLRQLCNYLLKSWFSPQSWVLQNTKNLTVLNDYFVFD